MIHLMVALLDNVDDVELDLATIPILLQVHGQSPRMVPSTALTLGREDLVQDGWGVGVSTEASSWRTHG